ncbi:hypothetical protein F9K73_12885 [Brucella intermedia]|uniref:hypothetical protein n=1 Tax=Brucella intermedia TaxID=94625 RepID=UPI00124E3B3C|nr:hypothetical protein [Brucella intermedia]KAB2720814.1 hypothetical protein F9K73_12885 [Brucella intermedia]
MSKNKIARVYRELAHQHLRQSTILAHQNNANAYRYACLELRMAIEAITYSLVTIYRSELDLSALRKWQPAKILKELLNIDPNVENPPRISIQNPADGKWNNLFHDEYRLSGKWLNKTHNTLSSFLHVQINRDTDENSDKLMKIKFDEYHKDIERALASPSWNIIVREEAWTYLCECGNTIVRRKNLVRDGDLFRCSECPRQYDSVTENGKLKLKLRRIVWTCNFCEAENAFPEHQLAERYLAKCRRCSEPAQIRKEWMFFQKEETDILSKKGSS